MSRWMLLLTLWSTHAFAGADFADEAKRRMKLGFDLDAVEARLQAAPAAAPARQIGDSYVQQPALPLEPNSTLDAVTVYRDRALVTRHRALTLKKGSRSVVFEGLPLGLDANSLHGQVGSQGARIVGVELISGVGEVEETGRIKAVRTEMLGITEELGQVRDRIESLLAQRSYLRSTLLAQRPEGQPQPKLDQVRGTLAYVGEAEGTIAAELRSEQRRASELGEKLHPLLIKLDNPLATGMTVKVDLDVSAGGSLDVALRYQVLGAHWSPSYNARLDADSGQVELEYFGMVSQATGEDWDRATLQLSTANPSVTGSVPELTPWVLGNSGIAAYLGEGKGDYARAGAAYGASSSATGIVSSDMQAGVGGSGAVVFAIDGRRSVKGDGSAQRIPIGTQTFSAELELAAVPKSVQQVFRRARIHYDGEVPLLPGPIASYAGGDYVGAGVTKAVVPGETLLLSFGTDDRVKVERKLVSRKQEFVGGRRNTRYTLHFRTTLTNFSDQPQTVQLLDQLPTSELDKVTIKVIELTPPGPADPADGEGIQRWTLALAPGASASVDLHFSVTAPTEIAQSYAYDIESMF